MPTVTESEALEFRPEDHHEPVVRLSFVDLEPDDPYAPGKFNVEVEADGMRCEREVKTFAGDRLDKFLGDLANDWRGWKGIRRWETIEHGMGIEATHRGNRVELLFIVRRDYRPDALELRLPILVAPGESLARLAKATAELRTFR